MVLPSSSRCYVESNTPIMENSSRLVDVCNDPEYILTDEYGLAKGKEESFLFNSEKRTGQLLDHI